MRTHFDYKLIDKQLPNKHAKILTLPLTSLRLTKDDIWMGFDKKVEYTVKIIINSKNKFSQTLSYEDYIFLQSVLTGQTHMGIKKHTIGNITIYGD